MRIESAFSKYLPIIFDYQKSYGGGIHMGGLMEKCEMTEEDIKLPFITPAIEAAGWDRQRQIKMEYSFTDGRVTVRGNVTARGKRKKADYLGNRGGER